MGAVLRDVPLFPEPEVQPSTRLHGRAKTGPGEVPLAAVRVLQSAVGRGASRRRESVTGRRGRRVHHQVARVRRRRLGGPRRLGGARPRRLPPGQPNALRRHLHVPLRQDANRAAGRAATRRQPGPRGQNGYRNDSRPARPAAPEPRIATSRCFGRLTASGQPRLTLAMPAARDGSGPTGERPPARGGLRRGWTVLAGRTRTGRRNLPRTDQGVVPLVAATVGTAPQPPLMPTARHRRPGPARQPAADRHGARNSSPVRTTRAARPAVSCCGSRCLPTSTRVTSIRRCARTCGHWPRTPPT